MFFFGSGRYKEQLKLLYKVHKVICRNASPPRGIRGASSAAMQVPLGGLGGPGGLPLPQGFVATFKSLVIFVSRKKLCSFVSLCFNS